MVSWILFFSFKCLLLILLRCGETQSRITVVVKMKISSKLAYVIFFFFSGWNTLFPKQTLQTLIFPLVSTNDSESYMNEEKKEEDLLNKCMQSMSIEEQGEHLMLTWQLDYWWCAKGGGRDCELCPLHLRQYCYSSNFSLFRNFYDNIKSLM